MVEAKYDIIDHDKNDKINVPFFGISKRKHCIEARQNKWDWCECDEIDSILYLVDT